jgi:hypothetical protein
VSSYPARILTSQKAHAYPWGAKHLRAKPLLCAQPKGAYCSRLLYSVGVSEVSSIEHQAKGKKHILLKYFILTAVKIEDFKCA